MEFYPRAIEELINHFSKLPSVGQKTAQRLAFHILGATKEDVEKFAKSMMEVKENVKYCSVCGNFTETDPCNICNNPNRNKKLICVVEQPKDIFAIERVDEYNGVYHVLHGAISPMKGIGPNDINLQGLLKRCNKEIEEIIVATNSNVEGEATAMYISKLLNPVDIKVTRIARGLPVGGDLEYADEVTLSKAFEGRIKI